MPNEIFRKNEFSLEVISKGSFVDDDLGFGGKRYIANTYTLRLNHIALNEWTFSKIHDDRDSYETEDEYKDYCEETRNRRAELEKRIAKELNIPAGIGSVAITQVLSEIFTVVWIYNI